MFISIHQNWKKCNWTAHFCPWTGRFWNARQFVFTEKLDIAVAGMFQTQNIVLNSFKMSFEMCIVHTWPTNKTSNEFADEFHFIYIFKMKMPCRIQEIYSRTMFNFIMHLQNHTKFQTISEKEQIQLLNRTVDTVLIGLWWNFLRWNEKYSDKYAPIGIAYW